MASDSSSRREKSGGKQQQAQQSPSSSSAATAVDKKPSTSTRTAVDKTPSTSTRTAVDKKPSTSTRTAVDKKPSTSARTAVDKTTSTSTKTAVDKTPSTSTRTAVDKKSPLLPQSTWDHVHRHIYESRHFEARLIGRLSEISAMRVDVIAQLMACTVGLLLLVPGIAPLMSAAVLIGYPIATTYLYPEEKASSDSLLIYWACYALLTFFDRYLEVIPGYYILKLALLAVLFLEPWRLVDVLQQSTSATHLTKKSMFDKSELETLTKGNKRSPRPEKPEEERAHSVANLKMTESAKPKMVELSTSPVMTAKAASTRSAVSVGLESKPLTKKWLSAGNKYKAVPLDLTRWKKSPCKQTSDTGLCTAMSTDYPTALSPDIFTRSPGSSRRLTAKSAMHSGIGIIVSPCNSLHDLNMCPTPKSSRLEDSKQNESAPYVPTYQEPPLPDCLISPKASIGPSSQPPTDMTLTHTARSISSTNTARSASSTHTARSISADSVRPRSISADSVRPRSISVDSVRPRSISCDSVRPNTSAVDLSGRKRSRDANPMAVDSSYRLDPAVPVSTAPVADAMEISPAHQLAFDVPFDVDHVTYHMKIRNISTHSLAFMIKGNAVPRVTASPPNGILQPDQTMVVGVTVKKFAWNPSDFNKDRICFEYVELKDELKDVKEFSHSLFKNSDLKRTRNIYVTYNV